jgi:hypothetical protein
MKILKGLLAALGLACALVAGMLLYISAESRQFKALHADYGRAFLHDLSLAWDLDDVRARLSHEFLERLESPAGRQALAAFRRLGPLEEIRDLELRHYRTTFREETGVFHCKARFHLAVALVSVTLRADGRWIRVHGLTIRPLGDLHHGNRLEV